ncbi:beta-ketoacyl-[acyl-carrier-protein] synthase family protein [Myxococcota bacterium]|nr:beta-ketoacyl-[acyl-carrier-protein] synthase family protein [Myxococcota bacterium]
MAPPRAVVTGMGAFTPLGPDLASSWARLVAGEIAVGRITRFDATGFATGIAAQADFPLEAPPGMDPGEFARFDRRTRMALVAADAAWRDAGLDASPPADPSRLGVSVGAEAARKQLEEVADRYFRHRHADSLLPVIPEIGRDEFPRLAMAVPAQAIARRFGARGPSRTSSTACTSGSQALGIALRLVRRGEADVVIAGGCDALVEAFMVMGFSLLGALSQRNDDPRRASRPFDADRDGFVLGEGAGFLVVESLEHARARGARVLAELAGYGSSNNAYRVTDSPPDGGGAFEAMAGAVEDAGIPATEVGYVNAHGTSTVMNDLSETLAIHRALGEHARAVTVSSNKGQIGHLVAAAGAVEAAFTVLALRNGLLPPTANLDKPDPRCDLDYVPHAARRAEVRYALSNSLGFGGSNATVALARWDR